MLTAYMHYYPLKSEYENSRAFVVSSMECAARRQNVKIVRLEDCYDKEYETMAVVCYAEELSECS